MIMTWKKSSRSDPGNCVEIRGDLSAVRDSKTDGPVLTVQVSGLLRYAKNRPSSRG